MPVINQAAPSFYRNPVLPPSSKRVSGPVFGAAASTAMATAPPVYSPSVFDYFRPPESILDRGFADLKEKIGDRMAASVQLQDLQRAVKQKRGPRRFAMALIAARQKLGADSIGVLQKLTQDCNLGQMQRFLNLSPLAQIDNQVLWFAKNRPNVPLNAVIEYNRQLMAQYPGTPHIYMFSQVLSKLPDRFFTQVQSNQADTNQQTMNMVLELIMRMPSVPAEAFAGLADKWDLDKLVKLEQFVSMHGFRDTAPLVDFIRSHPDDPERSAKLLEPMVSLKTRFPQNDNRFAVVAKSLCQGAEISAEAGQLISTSLDRGMNGTLKYLNHRQMETTMNFLMTVGTPDQFIDFYLDHQSDIPIQVVDEINKTLAESSLYSQDLKTNLAPELLAMAEPYAKSLDGHNLSTEQRFEFTRNFLRALKKLTVRPDGFFNFSNMVSPTDMNRPHAFSNLTRSANMGLGFIRWKLDTMARWKGMGPMQRPSLFEQSGLFKKIGPRSDDATYHGGFLHYDPEAGVSIEMRRAYIVISDRARGTLVIRNSSKVFGRDKLPEPGLYSENKHYGDEANLFVPERDLGEFEGLLYAKTGQSSVLDDTLTRRFENIHQLLNTFDRTVGRYIYWKNGFQGGKPSEGFVELLRTSLLSSLYDGAKSPFRPPVKPGEPPAAPKPVSMSWVNMYGLPGINQSFDSTVAANQKEMQFYEGVLSGKTQVTQANEYPKKMPELLKFLSFGLKNQGFELILTDAKPSQPKGGK